MGSVSVVRVLTVSGVVVVSVTGVGNSTVVRVLTVSSVVVVSVSESVSGVVVGSVSESVSSVDVVVAVGVVVGVVGRVFGSVGTSGVSNSGVRSMGCMIVVRVLTVSGAVSRFVVVTSVAVSVV